MMSRVPSSEGGIDGGEDCLKLRRSHLQERPRAADWRCFEPVHHMLAPVRRARVPTLAFVLARTPCLWGQKLGPVVVMLDQIRVFNDDCPP